MRLKKLLVAGFKSFVDLTDIRLPGHLVGVVGPNGCGKSNVIDAVRWVMGESSAKLLRGDSMSDVIFNGSTSRKPVGKASVELIFDNSDGKAPGNYARFSEISVKRVLTRDGVSDYLINNIKTRRKDVLDLFRGTGLGPRSYSIIEQGMVSRIVEAKPEEIRGFIEDAAGISRYKERRRETENRIEHTRSNLERVDDIRQEIARQLGRLKRQSNQARRFKDLKNEERILAGQYHVLQLRQLEAQLLNETRVSESKRNEMEAAMADLRKVEAEIAELQKRRAESQEEYDGLQEEYYPLSAQIGEIEQKIDFLGESKAKNALESERLEADRAERTQQIEDADRERISLEERLSRLRPDLDQRELLSESVQSDYEKADRALREWSAKMQRFNEQQHPPRQQVQIQRSRIEHLDSRLSELENERTSVEELRQRISDELEDNDLAVLKEKVSDHDHACQACESALQDGESRLDGILKDIETERNRHTHHTNQNHELNSRLNSLEEIQSAYLGGDDDAIRRWIESSGLEDQAKLVDVLSIEDGWERAVDRVLGDFLSATCAERISPDCLENRPDASLSLVVDARLEANSEPGKGDRLLDRIGTGQEMLEGLLAGVRIAPSTEDALARAGELKGRELLVTRDGVMVGPNWISFAKSEQMKTGMLSRREEISQLREKTEKVGALIDDAEAALAKLEGRRQSLDESLREQRSELARLRSDGSELHGRLGREETVWKESQDRLEALKGREQDLVARIAATERDLKDAHESLQECLDSVEKMDEQREAMIEQNRKLDEEASSKLSEVHRAKESLHETRLEFHRLVSEQEAVAERLDRLNRDLAVAAERLDDLALAESARSATEEDLKRSLEELLKRKSISGSRLFESKSRISEVDAGLSSVQAGQREIAGRVDRCREALVQQDMLKQEARVLHDSHVQAMRENDHSLKEIAADLPDDALVEEWESRLEQVRIRIDRIGPVNLVAIQEFEELSERMEYLDSQHADLTEALETLESVISKIDQESRARFKETFDKINFGFNRFFPELFGGGKADLLLVTDDLLTAGVTVMARPPGKRNSHIHLLSGGEKALTAVALLFSLFELNPAPFCMLDEVDAPLDDANVGRYCETLKRLANKSQMIVVTHNKITMESMDLLLGVTMEESGVSRIVSVDVSQAVEMAVG
ncbi:MAG: chromosome segregation protein SMC [Gammaproteobacteria bacterium]|nr:chromosome segregation protein SMC [Gammaproteobacteria bacterium]